MQDSNKKHGLDIFRTLGRINNKDREFYSNLSDEEKKAFQPFVVMRWMSGTKDERQIIFLNEFVNSMVYSSYNHKELLYFLMTICSSGKSQKYKWVKAKNKKSSNLTETLSVLREYFDYSSSEAINALPLLTDDDVLECAEFLGRQPDEIAKIKKELKAR